MADVPPISGFCDERFTPVRDAFEANFRDRDELGAAVAILVDGRPVVDMWAGWMDPGRTRSWEQDTLVAVFSVGKAMAAVCVLILVEDGSVDLDAPVSRYWPQFAAAGKSAVTVRMLLSHRAGVPAIRRALPDAAIFDWGAMAAALAEEEPWWEPGSTHGYHVNTFGFLTGELVRRVSGERIGAFCQRRVASRLDADFHFGIGPSDDARTAEYQLGAESPEGAEGAEGVEGVESSRGADGVEQDRPVAELEGERQFLLGRVYLNPPGLSGIGTVNTRAWRAAEIPSANAHATARAVARIYSDLTGEGPADAIRLLGPETIEQARTEHSSGKDFVLGRPSRFGLGFQLTQPERPLGPNPRSFGHFGAGGSLGFADPDARVAFAYTINRSGPRWQNPRNRALVDALYACL